MKVVRGNRESAKCVAQYLYQKYTEMGYVVYPSSEYETYKLHIRSDESGICGVLKGMTGWDKDIVVRIRPRGQIVTVEAKGNYGKKAGSFFFGTIACVPVAVSALCGSTCQGNLAYAIEDDAEWFLQNCASGAIPYTRSDLAIAE